MSDGLDVDIDVILLKASDNDIIAVKRRDCLISTMFREMITMDPQAVFYPVALDGETLKVVVDLLVIKQGCDHPVSFMKPIASNKKIDEIVSDDAHKDILTILQSFDKKTLINVLNALFYLDVPNLLQLSVLEFSIRLKYNAQNNLD